MIGMNMLFFLSYRCISLILLFSISCSSNEKKIDPIAICEPSVSDFHSLKSPLCLARSVSRTAEIEEVADQVVQLGAKSIRSDFLWHRIESQQGEWDFTHYDQVVDAFEERGIEVIPLLAYGVPWASSQTDSDSYYPPDDPADFANFARTVAERYKDRIQRFEIWNEPNAGFRFWKTDFSGNPEAFGALVLAAEEAIHDVHPEAIVILGGTFYHEQLIPGAVSFLQDTISFHPSILQRINSVAIHPYSLYPPVAAPEKSEEGEIPIWQMIENIQTLVAPIPVTVTEYGITITDDSSREEQAALLERGILLALAQGATDVCWYTIQNGDDPDNFEDNFGLLNNDGSWSPTAEAFYSLGEKLSSTTRISRVQDLPEGSWGVYLEGVGHAFWGEGEICGKNLTSDVTWILE